MATTESVDTSRTTRVGFDGTLEGGGPLEEDLFVASVEVDWIDSRISGRKFKDKVIGSLTWVCLDLHRCD